MHLNQLLDSSMTTYDGRTKEVRLQLADGSVVAMDDVQVIYVEYNGRTLEFVLKKEAEDDADLDDTLSCEDLSINLDDLMETFKKLTDDQRNIVMHVYYVYKNNKKNIKHLDNGEVTEDNPKIILQGPAGTGKSTIINLIEELITWEENKTSEFPDEMKVLKCAFTGKAASNIQGFTLHGIFPINNKKNKKGKKENKTVSQRLIKSKRKLLKSCVFFICDEISMVGKNLLNKVNKCLQLIFENNKLYGDRFVLLVGDLYQLDPVYDPSLYPDSNLWTCCEFYELNKIIRQQDERLIRAFNNFRDSKMIEEDMDLLKSREIKELDVVPDSVVHLFYLNKDVNEFNINKINKSNEHEETVNVIENEDNLEQSELRVKIGIRYMITKNLNVADGLTNGATGVVKGFDYNEENNVHIIWMEFGNDFIGRKARNKYFSINNKPGFEKWVPIQQIRTLVSIKSETKKPQEVCKMFPLRAAEAITVHKSQGQTFPEGVCIHVTKQRSDKLRFDKSLQYVALTRITHLENLYIYGSIDFTKSTSKKFLRSENEINKLRTERKLKLAYETFKGKNGDVIIFLNTDSTFKKYHQFITTDNWYSNGSILLLTETNTIGSDDIRMPNFEITCQSESKNTDMICYKKAGEECIDLVDGKIDSVNNSCLTLLLYKKFLYIIVGVKGKLNENDFKAELKKFMPQSLRDQKCILFVGNFNIGANETTLTDFLNDCNFKKTILCGVSSSGNSDIVCTRNIDIEQDDIGYYEYIPSSHKPIYVIVPPMVESVDIEKPGSSRVMEAMETD